MLRIKTVGTGTMGKWETRDYDSDGRLKIKTTRGKTVKEQSILINGIIKQGNITRVKPQDLKKPIGGLCQRLVGKCNGQKVMKVGHNAWMEYNTSIFA
jgi:hypothetical protein